MKIAFSTGDTTLEGLLEERFGRAPGFLIYDTQSQSCTFIENTQNLNAAQGAGIQSAQNIAKAGVNVVITGHCGPKAFKVLRTAGIDIYTVSCKTIREALTMFQDNQLLPLKSSDAESHW